jgi:ribosomal protein S11
MTQDDFTIIDQTKQTKSYAAIVAHRSAAANAHKSTPKQIHQKVAGRSNDTNTTRGSVTIKGVLITAIDNQQVM